MDWFHGLGVLVEAIVVGMAASWIALLFHELATNAAKYGALSNDTGRISVHWAVDNEALTFDWREEGGPPVAPVSRAGFGTRLIKRTLAAELNGSAELEFEPTGLVCRVEAPPTWTQPCNR